VSLLVARVPVPFSSCWPAIVGGFLLVGAVLGAARAALAQCPLCPDEEPPEVIISLSPSAPYSGSSATKTVTATVVWCDQNSLNQNTWMITLNGVDVSGNFSYQNHTQSGCAVAKRSVGSINLVHGTNTVYGEIRDNASNLGSGSVFPVYTQTHRAPDWGLDPHNGENVSTALCALNCFDGVYTYTTPAYVSMDTPRSVTLVYRSNQARAMGFVQVNVGDVSTVKADKTSLRLKRPDGSFVTFTNDSTELFWVGDAGNTGRLAGQFDASSLATGVHNYSLVLTNYWTSGGISHSVTVPVKVLIVNEKDSPFGWGWSMAGLQLIHANGDTLLAITEGDGSIAMFRRASCPSGCTYTSPAGDVSILTSRASIGGDGIKWDRTYPDGSVASFNSSGLLSFAKDRFGNQTTYSYTSNRLTSITDPAGKVTTIAYGGDNKIETITDPGARVVTFTVDGSLNVTAIQEPGGGNAFHSATYDGSHVLTGHSDKRGGAYKLAYDFAGKLAADTMPSIIADGGTVRPGVNYAAIESMVLVHPASNAYYNSPAPRLNPFLVEATVTNSRGYTTRMKLHASGAQTWVRDSLGRVSTLEFDALWRVTRSVAPTGHVTRYGWHATNRSQLTQQWDSLSADAKKVEYEYHGTFPGLVTRIKNDALPQWFYYHATTGHLDSAIVGTATSPAMKFYGRSDGRDTLHVDEDGFATRFVYAASGFKNLDTVVAPGPRKTSFTYDSYGRTSTTKDPLDYVTTVTYDALNRVKSAIGPIPDTTLFEYDSLYLKTVRDAIGQQYRYARNALGWVDTLIHPGRDHADSSKLVYKYDKNGNVRFLINRRGQTVETTFDALDRPLLIEAGSNDITFSYNAGDTLVTVQNGESIDTLRFDKAGRQTKGISRRGASWSIRHEVSSAWDDTLGQRKRYDVITTPGSEYLMAVNYTYESFHSLKSFTGLGGTTNLSYNNRRLANSTLLPNGLEILTNFPSTRRPGQIGYDNANLNSVSLNYYHDKLGRVSELKRTTTDTITTYSYDVLRRLGAVAGYLDTDPVCSWDPEDGFYCDPAGRTLVSQTTYSYDKVGNRNDSSAVIQAGNRLHVYGVHSMDYDQDGNLVRKYRTADSTVFNQRLTWNSLGQLEKVRTVRNGTADSVMFGYDGFGRRVRKSAGADTMRFVYDGNDVIMELNAAGSVTTKYTYYPGIDRPHAMSRNDSTFYFAVDQLGSVVGVVKSNETLAVAYRYSPFGVITDSTASFANRLRFAAREYDAETGLYYSRARYYDPQLGRFLSEDPIGIAGGLNLYAYAAGDPINLRDPLGLDPDDCPPGHMPAPPESKMKCILKTVVVEGSSGGPAPADEIRVTGALPNSRGPNPRNFSPGGGRGGSSTGQRLREAFNWSNSDECSSASVLGRARKDALYGAGTAYVLGFLTGFGSGFTYGAIGGGIALSWMPGGVLVGGISGGIIFGTMTGHATGKTAAVGTGALAGATSLIASAAQCTGISIP
jgi:RHS repeat-associated protein